jgi:internalin A
VLFSSDGRQWADSNQPLQWPAGREAAVITKIVIGTLESDKSVSLTTPLPLEFERRFPNLKQLCLWRIDNLTTVPALPRQLQTLDVRHCPKLAALPCGNLPTTLTRLIIADCPALSNEPSDTSDSTCFELLRELRLPGPHGLSPLWIKSLVRRAPELRTLDLTRCTRLDDLPSLPSMLEDLRLDECTGLQALPSQWPSYLRRLGLRKARELQELPRRWPKSIDYLDLAYAERLRQLPRPTAKWPRTLFLYGSGIVQPPASQHGSAEDENVAAATDNYFKSIDLVGEGEVRRCKVLVLGNGGAGKTCLSAALDPNGDPKEARRLGSTHGVRFLRWDLAARVGGRNDNVQLHLWDFGGQEIYHNTHRLFASKGTVFIVAWNPEQDGCQPAANQQNYQDEWRPLRYWIDYIRDACPLGPRIAIVCTHSKRKTPELEARLKEAIGAEDFERLKCFYIDSMDGDIRNADRDLVNLNNWLGRNVGEVVESQGTQVPAHWEIAQDLVESWVKKMEDEPSSDFTESHKQLPATDFGAELADEIGRRLESDSEGRFDQLAAAWHGGKLSIRELVALTPVLDFLTHSGWIFWDERLFEGRVIVGQQWAIDGLYVLLERENTAAYEKLTSRDGRFTISDLGELGWNGGEGRTSYGDAEQRLLLSFMERCGLCFKLHDEKRSSSGQDVYVSFEHLPDDSMREFEKQFERTAGPSTVVTEDREWTERIPRLHKHHWQAFLSAAGGHYGKDAQYARDAFYLENQEGGRLLVCCQLDKGGLGGELTVRVRAADAEKRLAAAVDYLARFRPNAAPAMVKSPRWDLGTRQEKREVFISYAWEYPSSGTASRPASYEEPVDAIENFLLEKGFKPVRDKRMAQIGDSIVAFMEYGAERPHVIVVHSDLYWRSPHCLYELKLVEDSIARHKEKSWDSVVIPVRHINSIDENAGNKDAVIDFWLAYKESLPPGFRGDARDFKIEALALATKYYTRLVDLVGVGLRWPGREVEAETRRRQIEEVLAEIAKRL